MKEVIKPTKPHKHAGYFELIFLSKGSGTHSIDDSLYEVNAPDLFFLRPNQTHCWDFSSIPKGYVLLFKEELFNNSSARDLLYKMPAHLPIKQDEFIETLLSKLKNTDADTEIVASYIHVLIHYVLEGLSIEESKTEDLFYEFKGLIDSSFRELRQVSEYAKKLHVTSKKLNELSKRASGKTAQEIIQERIFVEAKVLLTHTSKTISEIANSLNFSDSSHFNKFFSSHSNLTPGQYRKLLKYKDVQKKEAFVQ